MTTATHASDMREEDHAYFERELASFLPEKIFDAHCHIGRVSSAPNLTLDGADTGYDQYMRGMAGVHGGRRTAALFIPIFSAERVDRIGEANAWVAQEAARDPACRGDFFVRPGDDPAWVHDEVKRLGLHGLKCYHVFAKHTRPTWEAEIPDYLPEDLVKVADELGLVITLHMVRARAVADPTNIKWIRHYCRTYPNMKLILAHSARGFQPAHNLEGLEHLKGLENVYFDSSANCEPIAHQAIIRIMGHDRLMYGSDLPVSHLRGRSLSHGDTFLWLYEQTPVWVEKHQTIKPVLIGLEHLRSMKWACWSERLSDSQVEDVFWNNAARLLGVA